jgi:hypothetical protein
VYEDVDLAQDEPIDRTKNLLQLKFDSKNLAEFWCSLRQAHPRLVKRAVEALIPFATAYLCESGFSTLVTIKTKKKIEIFWMSNMTSVLPCQRPPHSLMFLFKLSIYVTLAITGLHTDMPSKDKI